MNSSTYPVPEEYGPRDPDAHPPSISPGYKSTLGRGPRQPPVKVTQTLSERTGPVLGVHGGDAVAPSEDDLTINARRNGEPLGERIIVTGRVLDETGQPVPNTLVEVWQANAAGRYPMAADQHDAPLDPNFLGVGRCATDAQGRYRFITIKPGAYPWGNHENAWRPAHIHFSLFGPSLTTRLVTQMYFPGDPLLALDPIYQAVPAAAQTRLIAAFSLEQTRPEWALGYTFDIIVRGPRQTPTE